MASTPPSTANSGDRLLGLLLFGSLALTFAPLFRWLGGEIRTEAQLSQSLLVFAATVAFVVYTERLPGRLSVRFDRFSLTLLGASYGCTLLAAFTPFRLLLLPAVALGGAALAAFLFGPPLRRVIGAAAVSLGLFLFLAAFLPTFDWPLRFLAGQGSAAFLTLCGQEVSLALTTGQAEPMLLLFHNTRPFHVAPECNGYGLLATSLLVALFLLLYRPISLLPRLGLFLLAIVAAYLANTLRIVVIVFLAPVVGPERYDWMHEIVGLAFFYPTLGLIVWAIFRLSRRLPPSTPETAPA